MELGMIGLVLEDHQILRLIVARVLVEVMNYPAHGKWTPETNGSNFI